VEDYTAQDRVQEQDFEDYQFAGYAPERTADEIEQDRGWKSPPPGEHEFIVKGFAKAPQPQARKGYLAGQEVQWTAYSVGVRLALASDPSCTVIDYFDLPPQSPQEQISYLHASKNPDGKNPGFMAEKFGHFVARLGFPFAKGQPIPIEARTLKNWKGRRIVATVELQDSKDPVTGGPKLNPATGEPYPPKAAVKLFSYRSSPNQFTTIGTPPAAMPQHAATVQAAPQHPQAAVMAPNKLEALRGML